LIDRVVRYSSLLPARSSRKAIARLTAAGERPSLRPAAARLLLVDRDDKHFHCIEAIHAVSAGEGPWGSRVVKPRGDPEFKYPIAGCCARAASGHAAAAPPSSVMNSRRFIFAVIR